MRRAAGWQAWCGPAAASGMGGCATRWQRIAWDVHARQAAAPGCPAPGCGRKARRRHGYGAAAGLAGACSRCDAACCTARRCASWARWAIVCRGRQPAAHLMNWLQGQAMTTRPRDAYSPSSSRKSCRRARGGACMWWGAAWGLRRGWQCAPMAGQRGDTSHAGGAAATARPAAHLQVRIAVAASPAGRRREQGVRAASAYRRQQLSWDPGPQPHRGSSLAGRVAY